jgi:hypothetical protein
LKNTLAFYNAGVVAVNSKVKGLAPGFNLGFHQGHCESNPASRLAVRSFMDLSQKGQQTLIFIII